MGPPSISKKVLWDTDFNKLDFEKYSLYIMEKVFNYGNWNDQVEIMRHYGLPRIRKEIINAGYLRKPVLSFLCVISYLQKSDFHAIKECSWTRYTGTTNRNLWVNLLLKFAIGEETNLVLRLGKGFYSICHNIFEKEFGCIWFQRHLFKEQVTNKKAAHVNFHKTNGNGKTKFWTIYFFINPAK